jgi:hypothetical protein
MVQLLMLAVAWTLLRRYVLRRRTRLVRASIVRQLTEKLRAMAKTARRASPARNRSAVPALSV